jgi:L-ribulokinase
MYAAVAAGTAAVGYSDTMEAARHMAHLTNERYSPIPANQVVDDRLYAEYLRLHDYFGRGENDAMKVLRDIKDEALLGSGG